MPMGNRKRENYTWSRPNANTRILSDRKGEAKAFIIKDSADDFYINWSKDLMGSDPRITTGPYRTMDVAERIVWDRILGVGK